MAIQVLLGCLLIVVFPRCEGQNLVPNPSFEELDTCPYWPGFQLGDRPVGWYSWNQSPDYFNACAQELNGADTLVGVPLNGWAFQNAWDGSAYVGMYAFATGDPYREYVGAQLVCPMIVGRTYSVSFRVNLARGGTTWNSGGACNNMGALFTMESNAWTAPFPNPPGPHFAFRDMAHVNATAITSDTAEWTLVSGNFVADSAYQHIVLGNFFRNTLTDTIPSEIGIVLAYYLIDSVNVTSAFEDCIPTGTMETTGPLPAGPYYDSSMRSLVLCRGQASPVEYVVVDQLGKVISAGRALEHSSVSTDQWPSGVYLLRTIVGGVEANLKFVVSH